MVAAVGITDTAADHPHLSLASPQPATAPANAEPDAVHDASSVASQARVPALRQRTEYPESR